VEGSKAGLIAIPRVYPGRIVPQGATQTDVRPRRTLNFGVETAEPAVEAVHGRWRKLVGLLRRYVTHADRTHDEEAAFRAWSRERFVDFLRFFSIAFIVMIAATWPGDLRFRGADQAIFDAFVIWRSVAIALFIPIAFIHRVRWTRAHPLAVAMFVYLAFVVVLGYALGRIGGLDSPWFYALYGCAWMTVIFPIRPLARVVCAFATCIAAALGYFAPFPEHFAHPHVEVPLINLASFTVVGILVGHIVHHLLRDNYFAHREADAERARAERLLHNMVPELIADRLKRASGPVGDRFEDITVLFADIVDFTGLSGRIPPEQLVRFLNDVYTRFDMLAERHGLEKIKTVGDGYVVAGGIPEPRSDHATAVAEMALDLLATASAIVNPEGDPVQLRIGIQTGPAVAGVIGVKKLTYDVWGDTVNMASRLESHGVAGRIQVGEACHARLRSMYRFEARGPIDLKGKGEVPVYFLVGRGSTLRG
jgi:class 3 adenylate cyclase